MELKIGDKVKFLNARGGGVVSRIIDTRMVNVAVEGGFEIPTLISELVRLEENEPAARYFTGGQAGRVGQVGQVEQVEQDGQVGQVGQERSEWTEENRIRELPVSVRRNRKSEEIYLAFMPHDQKWLISGMLDVILINNSSFDILYNLFLENPEGGYTGKDYGSCFPDSTLLLDTITREQLPEWTNGYLQFLFHKSAANDVLPPFNSQFKVSGQKFYNEKSYKETQFLIGKAILAKLLSVTDYFKIATASEEKVPGKKEPADTMDFINKHRINQREAEVDLHIHELIGEPGLLENHEILEFQKDYFRKCLDSAITNHFLKVTFIHGAGNGVLRDGILEILNDYEGVEVLDAPMQKYGMGALEIRIPHNY